MLTQDEPERSRGAAAARLSGSGLVLAAVLLRTREAASRSGRQLVKPDLHPISAGPPSVPGDQPLPAAAALARHRRRELSAKEAVSASELAKRRLEIKGKFSLMFPFLANR